MNHRQAKLLLVAVLLAFLSPFLLRREVVFPHDNSLEVGILQKPDGNRISNRKFSDQSSVYIPEIHHQLCGDSSGWISTWNPYSETGRPTAHICSFSKAFVLTHILSWFTDDAFSLYTWLTFLAVFLTGLFAYLLLEVLGLHPAACFAGALGLGFGVFVIYWLTFVMFIWGICWTLALLLLVTFFFKRATFARGVGIAFAVYALFLTAYPQQIVWHVYLVSCYTAFCLVRMQGNLKSRLVQALKLAGVALLGLACASPVYLDLALNASRSARMDADPSFFLAALPQVKDMSDLFVYCTGLFDAFWFGNPIQPDYPMRFNGLCMTPLFSALFMVSFISAFRVRCLWPVQAFVGFCLLMTFWPGLYLFGVEYLGFGFSRFVPLAGAYIPALVLAAFAADHTIRGEVRCRRLCLVFACLPAGLALKGLLGSDHQVDSLLVAMGSAFFLGSLAFLWTRRPAILVLLAVLGVFHYSLLLPLTRPKNEIRRTSPLVERLRSETQDGSRFALVGSNLVGVLPSNQEALLGLRTIHTYNSLSAESYQRWVKRLSLHGTRAYGRYFQVLDSDALLKGTELGYSGVGILVSSKRLDPEVASPVATVQGLVLSKSRSTPLLEAQVGEFDLLDDESAHIQGALEDAGRLAVRRILNHDDHLRFEVTQSERQTVLFVSQQYHPQWKAFGGGSPMPTVMVNGFYQGVLVPPDTRAVELRFLPHVRLSWIPQLLFLLAAVLIVIRHVLGRKSR